MSDDTQRRAFGRYELLDEIGRGGMGVVYRARQTDLDREVAIKMILGRHLAVPEFARRLNDEAVVAARVNHPNIVGVIETGEHSGQRFIAMEFVQGRTLAGLLAGGATELRDRVRIIADVAHAVQHLHDQSVLHLDLKPANILVTDAGRAKITDFGLARPYVPSQQPKRVVDPDRSVEGTPGYIAPELLRGVSEPTPRCDVYSLGALLYEAVTGNGIFADATVMDRLLRAMHQDPAPPRAVDPKIPLELETIILACLDRNPARRYASAAEVAADLECFLTGEPISRAPAVGWPRLRRWIRRYPALAVRLMAFVAFAGLLTGNLAGGLVAPEFYRITLLWLATWLGVSAALQVLAGSPTARRGRSPRLWWAAADASLMAVVLGSGDGPASPMVTIYPLMIVTAGFWLRVSLVLWVGAFAVLSYGIVWVHAVGWQPANDVTLDRHLLVLVVMLLATVMMGMQVRRTRAITRFYAERHERRG